MLVFRGGPSNVAGGSKCLLLCRSGSLLSVRAECCPDSWKAQASQLFVAMADVYSPTFPDAWNPVLMSIMVTAFKEMLSV